MALQSWDSWGADDLSINRSNGPGAQGDVASRFGHRSQLEPSEETEVDYFQDMAPEFKKAAKVSHYPPQRFHSHFTCNKMDLFEESHGTVCDIRSRKMSCFLSLWS